MPLTEQPLNPSQIEKISNWAEVLRDVHQFVNSWDKNTFTTGNIKDVVEVLEEVIKNMKSVAMI